MLVSDLAERTGTSVRTIRYYQAIGALPPPERKGRDAVYGEQHAERLKLITDLKERGLRLNAITELLATARHGELDEWLGLGDVLEQPWSDDKPELLSEAELEARLAELPDMAPATATDQLVAAGIVERRSDTSPVVYLVPSSALLDVALAWGKAGLDLEAGARLQAVVREHVRAMADEVVARFTEEVSFQQLSERGPAALAELLQQTKPLMKRTVDIVLAHEMERATRSVIPTD